MSDSNPGKEVGMGNAVIAGEKAEEVKSKIDPGGVMDVAINRVKESIVLTLSLTEP